MCPEKTSFDEYVASCTPLLQVPAFEREMKERVCEIVGRLIGFNYAADPVQNLIAFMREDIDFFKVLLNMTSLSQEKFRRIIGAERHARGDYGSEWGIKKIHQNIRSDEDFAEKVALAFIEGKNNPLLIEHVADFYIEQLAFPKKWADMLQDRDFASKIARRMLFGDYSDKKGDWVEGIVAKKLDETLAGTVFTARKGRVPFLGKEVDLAVPSINDPDILIMISYMETTSSNQTTRANEQEAMFDGVKKWNSRNRTNKAFINVVDGGGWLARRSDLRRLHTDSHYCLNLNTLNDLDGIVHHHFLAMRA